MTRAAEHTTFVRSDKLSEKLALRWGLAVNRVLCTTYIDVV